MTQLRSQSDMVCLVADGETEIYLEGYPGCLSVTIGAASSKKSHSSCPLVIKQNSPLNHAIVRLSFSETLM